MTLWLEGPAEVENFNREKKHQESEAADISSASKLVLSVVTMVTTTEPKQHFCCANGETFL